MSPVFRHEQNAEEKAASKRGKAAKVKGKKYEKDLFDFFTAELKDYHVSQGKQAGKGGKGNPDILLQGRVRNVHVEAKKGKRVNIKKAYEQAYSDARPTDLPVVCSYDDYGIELVTMNVMDFADLLNLAATQTATGHVQLKLTKGLTYSVDSGGE